MTAFVVNDDEWHRLFDEPPELIKVYCALRRVMDFKTGVAGLTYRINEGFFTDLLYVAPVPGRHSPPKVTRQKIRSILNRLEKIGLIKHHGQFVFKLKKATTDKSVQNSSNRGTTRAATRTNSTKTMRLRCSNNQQ